MIEQRTPTALVVTLCPPVGDAQRPEASPETRPLPEADLVIAADGGLGMLRRAGRRVDAVVGDMDSVDEDSLAWALSQGASILRHPVRKDFTDLELAMDYACSRAGAVHVAASVSGRLDHAVANLLILASPRWAAAAVTATVDGARVEVARGPHRLEAEPGETVSLLAVGGRCRVADTSGLEYRLRDEWLDPASARGVSNVVTAQPATLNVTWGALLAIFPGLG
ncbi:MAG: thiamine diphosphokinase [Acidimicrobiaceae bacterium]|nr:thiamine diphosphokinase [Acidimicrobiaceae bacterium]MCY4280793.1 thiamine diphosphokinase [Acidimicrobiaceae bacterium]MCY4295238.1 thiamine diphosphokinase [Acidimicrobiaceae bacterium]